MKHSKYSKKRVIKSLQSCCAVVAAGLFISTVFPDAALASDNNPKIDYGLTAGFSSMSINNTHFGLGQLDVSYLPKDIARSEAYIAPSANLLWKTADSGTIYGGLRGVGSITRGDGDSWGLTAGEHHLYTPIDNTHTIDVLVGEKRSYLNLDKAYLGWKSGDKISFLDKDGLDISVGKQNFQLADGMVLTDGNDEASPHKGIYWLDPRTAWNNTAIVRLKSLPYQLELFYLQSNSYLLDLPYGGFTGDVYRDDIVGGNFELVDKKLGKVGVSYFKVVSSNNEASLSLDNPGRDGLSVIGIHGRGNPVSTLKNLELAGEVDFQKNNTGTITRDARAWFAEAKYFMPSLPWYPTLGYRYSAFSGDKRSTTNKNEGWDYLYNGSTERGFGYWYQGIVVGTYETRLSNLNTHFVNLTLIPPVKGGWMKVFYYNYQFDETSSAGMTNTVVSSNKFASEWDVVLGYSPTQKVDYMLIYGNAKPAQGGIDRVSGTIGPGNYPVGTNDRHTTMLQFTMLYHL
ncbi:MAG: alginate export family protein [Chlorobium sp.]